MTEETFDYQHLDKEMDRVKTRVFLGKNAAFLGPLMCSLTFGWNTSIPTAQTDGLSVEWSPKFFLGIPFETRMAVLLHELWHVAFLHMVRRGEREPKRWNIACDLVINNMLVGEGYTFDGTHPWIDDDINRWKHPMAPPCGIFGARAAEMIYDLVPAQPEPPYCLGGFSWGSGGDLLEPKSKTASSAVINAVVQAAQAAKMSGGGNGVPSEIENMLRKFLSPKLPWTQLLFNFFNELGGEDYSWSRPDRRYEDVYLPSLQEDESRLEHLMYFIDESGSVTDAEIVRSNSEIKYIKDTFNPQLLTVVLFDDCIQREYVFTEEDGFEEIIVTGRGGTNLEPVREHIIKNQPTAVVVFSDLLCAPMEPLPSGVNIPIIWIGVNARPDSHVNMGKLIHIKE